MRYYFFFAFIFLTMVVNIALSCFVSSISGVTFASLKMFASIINSSQYAVSSNSCNADFAEKLDPFVREKYLELQKAVEDSQ